MLKELENVIRRLRKSGVDEVLMLVKVSKDGVTIKDVDVVKEAVEAVDFVLWLVDMLADGDARKAIEKGEVDVKVSLMPVEVKKRKMVLPLGLSYL